MLVDHTLVESMRGPYACPYVCYDVVNVNPILVDHMIVKPSNWSI